MQNISEAEKEIMNFIWKNGGSIFLMDLANQAQNQGFSWGLNTIRTFLTRLREKGYISTKMHGKTAEYIAVISEEAYLTLQANTFINTFFNGNVKGLLTTLFGHESLDNQQLKELEKFWKEGKADINE